MTAPAPLTGNPTSLGLVGSTLDFVLTSQQTGGRFAIITLALPPRDPGPPLHTHTREDETFYVLDGPVVFIDDGTERTLAAGECFHAVRNRPHKFYNPLDKPAKLLILLTPAADDGFYGYIHAVCEPGAPTGPPTEAHLACVLENGPKFGIAFHL